MQRYAPPFIKYGMMKKDPQGPYVLYTDHLAAIQELREKASKAMWMTSREKCREGCQCCSECNEMWCGDNTSPAVLACKELREALRDCVNTIVAESGEFAHEETLEESRAVLEKYREN